MDHTSHRDLRYGLNPHHIDRAARSHLTHIIQTAGSLRDGDVTAAADAYGMVMLHSRMRHFLH